MLRIPFRSFLVVSSALTVSLFYTDSQAQGIVDKITSPSQWFSSDDRQPQIIGEKRPPALNNVKKGANNSPSKNASAVSAASAPEEKPDLSHSPYDTYSSSGEANALQSSPAEAPAPTQAGADAKPFYADWLPAADNAKPDPAYTNRRKPSENKAAELNLSDPSSLPASVTSVDLTMPPEMVMPPARAERSATQSLVQESGKAASSSQQRDKRSQPATTAKSEKGRATADIQTKIEPPRSASTAAQQEKLYPKLSAVPAVPERIADFRDQKATVQERFSQMDADREAVQNARNELLAENPPTGLSENNAAPRIQPSSVESAPSRNALFRDDIEAAKTRLAASESESKESEPPLAGREKKPVRAPADSSSPSVLSSKESPPPPLKVLSPAEQAALPPELPLGSMQRPVPPTQQESATEKSSIFGGWFDRTFGGDSSTAPSSASTSQKQVAATEDAGELPVPQPRVMPKDTSPRSLITEQKAASKQVPLPPVDSAPLTIRPPKAVAAVEVDEPYAPLALNPPKAILSEGGEALSLRAPESVRKPLFLPDSRYAARRLRGD